MKKILHIYLMLALSLSIISCNMEKLPEGTLDDKTALQILNDLERFRNSLYGDMRALTNGSFVYLTDLQADQFQATVLSGNRNGVIHSGIFTSKDAEFQGRWGSCYAVISSVNYYLEKVNELKKKQIFTDEEMVHVERYIAEAKFVRALSYYMLADRYCELYTEENATTPAKGLPLVTKYHPTGDSTKYPGRNTQEETYYLIDQDLSDAYFGLVEYEKIDDSNMSPNASYLSSNAVLALQARIALNKGDKRTALRLAEKVIESGKYRLARISEVQKMWKSDDSKEIIFRPFMSQDELGASIGSIFLGVKRDQADFIPSFETLSLFSEGDIRRDVYFTIFDLNIEGELIQTYVFNKYPGNEALRTTSEPNYMNMSKPFRLSEMYLIAAEAAIEIDPAKANYYLKELRVNRIAKYNQDISYQGSALIEQIREERTKELLGEGHRLKDLQRWNLGFVRGVEHIENPKVNSILAPNGKGVRYQSNDYRYVWPIPSAEMQANPQLSGQQNEGY